MHSFAFELLFLAQLLPFIVCGPLLDFQRPILDVAAQADVSGCDAGLVSSAASEVPVSLVDALARPVSVVVEDGAEALLYDAYLRCGLHIVDLGVAAAGEYISAAWEREMVGQRDFYLFVFDNRTEGEAFFRANAAKAVEFLNIVAISRDDQDPERFVVYTYYKFGPGEDEITMINLWNDARGFIATDAIYADRYADLSGKTLRVTFPTIAVYFFKEYTFYNGTSVTHGIDKIFVEFIASAMNFHIHLVDVETNSFNGMVGMIQRGECDMAAGAITITAVRGTAVDFSYPYDEDKIGFVARKPSPLPKYQALMWPFQMDVWLSVAAAMAVFWPLYWAVGRFLARDTRIKFGIAFLHTWMPVFAQGIYVWGTKRSVKVLLLSWAVFGWVIDLAYSGNLVAMLTYPARSKALNTFADILNSDTGIIYHPGSVQYELFMRSSDPVLQGLYQRILGQGDEYTTRNKDGLILDRVLDENVALVIDKEYITLEVAADWTSTSGETDMHVGRQGLQPSNHGYPMTKRAPYRKNVNKWIKRALWFGLTEKWFTDAGIFIAEFKRIQRLNGVEIPEVEVKFTENLTLPKLTMENMQGAFYLLFIGMAMGLLSNAVEQCSMNHKKKKAKANRMMDIG